ncbi:ACL114Wp [Eremothecium gossypii ATCC 10895]|uniref:triacylglycerol lipase n=1 Tax=Eremothecium gossypii (strain ATCC 10895 / CBS 109.51 / FGSC 9923 / NRRL Y-1056) TaxID=284811 RepID=Q75CN3_EREGS|nr:ACL114Wp [Eremothecium gossypii ATCC 10895]AAS51114.1 ACL114Wp [Eremothecium gossypii ATCC 10895]AEY95404.1 FACL114Wp [Eremothecium gossypii FDAG1]
MKLSPFCLIFSLLASVNGYSVEVYNELKHYAYISNAAYCVSAPLLPSMLQKGSVFMEKDGLRVLNVFQPKILDERVSCSGYIGLNDTAKKIVIAFRGSVTVPDWLVDFSFLPTNYVPVKSDKRCEGTCLVHHGVYDQFKVAFPDIYAVFQKIAQQHPDYEVTVTGHSLGGGYAYLMGLELQLLGHKPHVITYAGLRMGNADLNKWYDKVFDNVKKVEDLKNGGNPRNAYIRVVQSRDIVPMVPTGPIYTHAGILFTITDVDSEVPLQSGVRLDGCNTKLKELVGDILFSGKLLSLVRLLDHNKFFRRMALPCTDNSLKL